MASIPRPGSNRHFPTSSSRKALLRNSLKSDTTQGQGPWWQAWIASEEWYIHLPPWGFTENHRFKQGLWTGFSHIGFPWGKCVVRPMDAMGYVGSLEGYSRLEPWALLKGNRSSNGVFSSQLCCFTRVRSPENELISMVVGVDKKKSFWNGNFSKGCIIVFFTPKI